VDHPDGQTEILVVARTLQYAVTQRDGLGTDPLEPELGIGRAEVPGALQRRVCEVTAREGEESCIDFWHKLTL
jgi:hypothetical protein